jgi:hypothetical protein
VSKRRAIRVGGGKKSRQAKQFFKLASGGFASEEPMRGLQEDEPDS